VPAFNRSDDTDRTTFQNGPEPCFRTVFGFKPLVSLNVY